MGSGGGAAGVVPSPGSGPGRERGPGGPSSNGEKVVTLMKPYSAEVWIYRCRVKRDICGVWPGSYLSFVP